MSSLAAAFAERLSSSESHLVVLDDGTWIHHPWPEVHARSQNVAEWLLNDEVIPRHQICGQRREYDGMAIGRD